MMMKNTPRKIKRRQRNHHLHQHQPIIARERGFSFFAFVVVFGVSLEMWISFTQPIPMVRFDLPVPDTTTSIALLNNNNTRRTRNDDSLLVASDALKKPRVVLLTRDTRSTTFSTTTQTLAAPLRSFWRTLRRHRSVPALSTGPCPYCQKESDSHIWPFEKPYYEQCTFMADWQATFYPNCNQVHEIAVDSADVILLSMKGSWRSVWHVQQQDGNHDTDTNSSSAVLKLLKFDRREFDHESFYYHRIDAMSMERLTASPYIINSYGYCGQTVLTEYAPGSARTLVKGKHFGSLDRLKMGRDLAYAFAALHSIDYTNSTNATLAHNDINMANAVEVNGRIKLNDFNIGILMKWNGSQPCGSPVRFEAKLWKSPEEILNASYVDPALADVYGLGNLLFQVMTKHQPWTHLEPNGPVNKHEVAKLKVQGQLPFVPDKHALSNKTAIQALYYATMACFRPMPQDRLSSFELAQTLDLLVELISFNKKKIPREDVKQMFERKWGVSAMLQSIRAKKRQRQSKAHKG